MSREAMERLEAQKIDLRYSIRVPQNGVGMWLAVMDEKGDLAGSTSQMPGYRAAGPLPPGKGRGDCLRGG